MDMAFLKVESSIFTYCNGPRSKSPGIFIHVAIGGKIPSTSGRKIADDEDFLDSQPWTCDH
jgi:hypothetical protein